MRELDSIGSTTIASTLREMQSSTWVTCRPASAWGSSTTSSTPSSSAALLPPATLDWKYAICRLNVTKQIVLSAAAAIPGVDSTPTTVAKPTVFVNFFSMLLSH